MVFYQVDVFDDCEVDEMITNFFCWCAREGVGRIVVSEYLVNQGEVSSLYVCCFVQ